MNKSQEIKDILEKYPQYREALFCRGYLVTSRILDITGYPFYNQWKKVSLGSLNNGSDINIYYHRWQDCNVSEKDGITAAIIGHAYNPFDMKHKEAEILNDCLHAYKNGRESFFEKVSELTGIHLLIINDKHSLIAVQDCSGMTACIYGKIGGDIYVTSHPQLVADLCSLKMDPFVRKLTGRWFYKLGNGYLPGNLTPYRELRKLGPNTFLEFKKEFKPVRFFPLKPHPELKPEEYNGVLDLIHTLLKNNIELCTLKWKKPALSLSGGMDSKTTLACANGLYDRLRFYSYHSKPPEVVDANAAHKICSELGLEHRIYPIQDKNAKVQDYALLKKIIDHNISYTYTLKDYEVRKYIYLYKLNDFDVELKSWVFETGRVMRERRYGVRLPDVLTPRHFSIFQTRYVFAPGLLRQSDGYYKCYLKEIGLDKPLYNYEHADFHFWEIEWGFWGSAVVIGQNIFRHTVTMPMNNRRLLDMFLWFPHDYRKNDMVHKEIIKRSNGQILNLGINVQDPYLGGKRIFLDHLYYRYATLFNREK